MLVQVEALREANAETVRNAKGLLRYNTCDRKQLQDWAGLGEGTKEHCTHLTKSVPALLGTPKQKLPRRRVQAGRNG